MLAPPARSLELLTLVGSLRRDSVNRALMRAAVRELEAGGSGPARAASSSGRRVTLVTDFDVGLLPHYDADLEGPGPPPSVLRLREILGRVDGVLIATPEYNYSIPGPLKNALDWGSRPAYRSPFVGKPVAVLGAARSPVGTARAQAHLKQVLLSMLAAVYPGRELGLGGAQLGFTDAGGLADEATRVRLSDFVAGFLDWIDRVDPATLGPPGAEPGRPRLAAAARGPT